MGLSNIFLGAPPLHEYKPGQHGYFTGRVEEALVPEEQEELPDFSQEVAQLAASPDKVWESSPSNAFKKDGKINFLHLNDEGLFTLTIVKPGSQTELQSKIPEEMVATVRENLKSMKDWDKTASPETWSMANGDQNSNTYMFNRYLLIHTASEPAMKWKLQWEGRHTNRGNMVEVRDTLRFVKTPPLKTAKK